MLRGLLWRYFGNQDDPFEQTARRKLLDLRRAVGAVIDLDTPAPELIRSAVHAAAGLLQTYATEGRALNEIIVNLRAGEGWLQLRIRD